MSWAANLALVDDAVRATLGPADLTYTPEGGSATALVGMFDANHELVLDGIESVGPVLFLDAENVAVAGVDVLKDKPAIVIGADSYTVRQRQTDGQGGARLLLKLVVA